VPDRPAVVEHDGVDGAQLSRLGAEIVEVFDHLLLAGVGDVEPPEAEPQGGRHQLSDISGGESERVEVDDLVEVANVLPVSLTLVQGRAHGRPDAGPDQPYQISLVVHGRLPVLCTNQYVSF
jgi:hypothetical protein